jgi:hypothetical protein
MCQVSSGSRVRTQKHQIDRRVGVVVGTIPGMLRRSSVQRTKERRDSAQRRYALVRVMVSRTVAVATSIVVVAWVSRSRSRQSTDNPVKSDLRRTRPTLVVGAAAGDAVLLVGHYGCDGLVSVERV